MIVPYMGFFIVNVLGQEPWTISVYAGGVAILATLANKYFARRIDNGDSAFSLIGLAVGGYLMGCLLLALFPSLPTVLSVGIIGFGVSTSAISTMFSLGVRLAENQQLDRTRINAYMRATTSTAWMAGPALSFFVADSYGGTTVFSLGATLSIIWILLWWNATPKHQPAKSATFEQDTKDAIPPHALWLAVLFIFCLSSAHSLTFTALPLFYVQEVGLPGYAPGTAFTMKTLIEVFAIFTTPFLIVKFGLKKSLLATSVLAVVTIQFIAYVQTYPQMLLGAAMEGLYYGLYASLGISYIQSFARGRSAHATALYWNTLIISGVLAGPAVGLIAQFYNFQTAIQLASIVALFAALVLIAGSLQDRKAAQ
ncbi:MAG: MFS transporter [Granulosicoccus sp.]